MDDNNNEPEPVQKSDVEVEFNQQEALLKKFNDQLAKQKGIDKNVTVDLGVHNDSLPAHLAVDKQVESSEKIYKQATQADMYMTLK